MSSKEITLTIIQGIFFLIQDVACGLPTALVEVCVQADFKSFKICIITMDSSKASLTISDPSEDNEKRKYSLRIDYAAKVSRVVTCIGKHSCS